MVIYFGVFLFLCCLSIIEFKVSQSSITKKGIVILIFITIIVMSVLRKQTVGGDLDNYENSFLLWKDYSIQQVFGVRNCNIGFVFLNWIVGKFTNSVYGLMIVSAIITYGLWFLVIKQFSTNISMSAVIYFALGGFANLFSGLRQALAVALLFYGVANLVKGKILKFFFWFFLAVSVHSTALVGILYVLIVMTKKKDMFCLKIVTLIMGIMLVATVGIPVLLDLYRVNDWHDRVVQGQGGMLLLFATAVMLACYIGIRNHRYTVQNINQISFNSCLVGTIIQILALSFATLTRLTDYFFCFFTILIPNLLMKESHGRDWIAMGILSVALVYFGYGIYLDLSGIVPYEFFWQ